MWTFYKGRLVVLSALPLTPNAHLTSSAPDYCYCRRYESGLCIVCVLDYACSYPVIYTSNL